MARDSALLQLRLDEGLKAAFTDAVRREHTTPSRALRSMVEDFVRQSRRKEAIRQTQVVAGAPDADETIALLIEVQDLDGQDAEDA